MVVLLSKEIKSLLCSWSGLIFLLIFLLLSGSLLWIIPGEYNLIESNYASLSPFFTLAPFLFMLLISALAMRSFAEEQRLHTLSLLLTRPVSLPALLFSKITAVWIVALVALILTLVYPISIYYLGNPVGNLDLRAISASYTGLLFLALSFSCITVFTSSLTSNQAIALILGLSFSAGIYFGFDLLSGLFVSGKTQVLIKEWGLLSHYQSVQRGLIDSQDLFYMLAISVIFFMLTAYVLRLRFNSHFSLAGIGSCLILVILSCTFGFRMDWTKEKRYTLSEASQSILSNLQSPVTIELYLHGRLNPGFVHLQQAVLDEIDDFNRFSSKKIEVHLVNPYQTEDKNFIQKLNNEGIHGIAVNEKDAEGKMTQHIIFPWMKIHYKNSEKIIPLLVNQQGRSGEENLNTSIEMLEYQLAHTIQQLTTDKIQKIVFLEGHKELDEISLADLMDLLSDSYQIDRGIMSTDLNQLNEYDLVVVAGPQLPYAEYEKYILDQYLMRGGKILWILNGVQLQSAESLALEGKTVSRINEVNLGDLLFNYGVRINPVLLQDVQCSEIPINVSQESSAPEYTLKPWLYAPLLVPNQDHPITKGITLIKSKFASSLSFPGKDDLAIHKQVLLTTSRQTHVVQVPEIITLQEVTKQLDHAYFNQSYLPVAALLEGNFNSGFNNRMLPIEIKSGEKPFLSKSKPTRMMVLASEEVIRNEIYPESKTKHWPLGYDPYIQVQYSNREFIANAVNYLTDSSGLMSLRNKTQELRLLDKQKIQQLRGNLFFLNVFFPAALIVVLFFIITWNRKRKYKTWS